MSSDFQQINDYNFNIDSFVQGNNGAVLRFNVRRKGNIVPIDNATVNVAIKRGNELITKNATIISAESGICEVILTRADLETAGTYYLQPTIIFPDDDEFSGDVQKFVVSGKLTGAPTNPGNGGTNPVFTVRDSAINGNVIINGAETVVYDDTGKVDKVAGKGLSTNDYDNIEKAEVAKVKDKADKSYVDNGLLTKVDKVAGKGLSTNDYDNTEKSEVAKVTDKADKTYVDAALGLKADKTYVDTQLSDKATQASLNTTNANVTANTNAIGLKADKTYVDASLADITTNGLPSKANKSDYGIFLSDFPRIAVETDDSPRIGRAITATPTGGNLFLGSNISLSIASKITITKSIHIVGYNTEFKTVTGGLDKSLLIQNVTDFYITGVRFNQNLLGRTSIHLSNVTDFIIENCYFTGYSLDYGFYQTDSGILMDGCINGRISRNLWENHGYQYDNATNHLNRCITVQSSCDRIVISNNQFDKVNQGIVIDSTNVIASGNTFNEVKDNSFYIVGGSGFSIQGNIFTGQRDEVIVFGGITDISITGNIFREVTNKIFTIDGDTQNVTISGNTTVNITQSFANIMSYRQNTFTVKNMNISGNTFRSIVNGNSFDVFQLGNLDGLIMNGNVIEVVTVSNQRIIGFSGATLVSGIIANNIFKCSTFDTAIISRAVVPTTYSMTFINNEMNNGRFSMTPDLNCEGYDVNNLNYATKLRKKKTIFTAAIPTSGTWQRGDILYNTTEGSATRGWECTASGVAGSTAVFTAF